MAIKDILFLGNDVLRQKSSDIIFPLKDCDKQLLIDLKDTINDFKVKNGFGRGIAAPQIGVLKNVVCIDMGTAEYFINPKIVEFSENKYYLFDDCFSMPEIMVYIERSREIAVEYYDEHGSFHRKVFKDDMSELMQHEIDHLNGIMAIDRVNSTKDIYSRNQWKSLLKS